MRGFVDSDANNHIRDLDMRDARNAADFFSSVYRMGLKDACLEPQRVWLTGIVCHEDIVENDLQANYVEKVFDGCDTIFNSEGSGIANLLGIPMLIRASNDPQPKDNQSGDVASDRDNPDAALLLRDISSTTTGSQESTRSHAHLPGK